MFKLRVSHILQASAVATVAMALSGVALASDTATVASGDQTTQSSKSQSVNLTTSGSSQVQVNITTTDTQLAGNAEYTGLGHTQSDTVAVSSDSKSSVSSTANPSDTRITNATTAQPTLASSQVTDPTTASATVMPAETPVSQSLTSVRPVFVSQAQIVSAAQATMTTEGLSTTAALASTTSTGKNSDPVGNNDIPSLPGTIAQRLGTVVSSYTGAFTLSPVASSSSTLPAILSALLAISLLSLLAVGSLYLARLHASGYQGAGRGIPSTSFVADQMMSFTGAWNALASSFFNRLNTQTVNLMLT